MRILNKVVPVYVKYTTKDNLPGVRARTWHPVWFIPMWKIKIGYWIGVWRREATFQEALVSINLTINNNDMTPGTRLKTIEDIIQNMNCGFECNFVEPYGFVPEAGCPIHD